MMKEHEIGKNITNWPYCEFKNCDEKKETKYINLKWNFKDIMCFTLKVQSHLFFFFSFYYYRCIIQLRYIVSEGVTGNGNFFQQQKMKK